LPALHQQGNASAGKQDQQREHHQRTGDGLLESDGRILALSGRSDVERNQARLPGELGERLRRRCSPFGRNSHQVGQNRVDGSRDAGLVEIGVDARAIADQLDLDWLAGQYVGGEVRWNAKLAGEVLRVHNPVVALFQPLDQLASQEPGVRWHKHGDRITLVSTAETAGHIADEVEEDHRHDKGPKQCLAAREQVAEIAVGQIERVSQHTVLRMRNASTSQAIVTKRTTAMSATGVTVPAARMF
jgi:hypothetical protein